MLGIRPKLEIVVPQPSFPEPLRYLWDWFQEIRTGVQGNGTTYPVITWEAIAAWSQLMRIEIAPRDVRIIVGLSNTWAVIMQEIQQAKIDAAQHKNHAV